jgi:tRNA G18 (ribose-2'-O)-methylase SpoU
MNTNSVEFFKNRPLRPLPGSPKLILAAWEISNPNNMGHIIRLGHNLGVEKVLFIADTIEKRESKIRKTAGFSFDQQAWAFVSEKEFIAMFLKEYKLVVLETCNGSENIYEVDFPEKMILLAGNESHGVPEDVIKQSDLQIYIPMPGGCKSMNISHALSVAGFEWYRKIRANSTYSNSTQIISK